MIYLDNAATTFPKPDSVYEKTFQFLRNLPETPAAAVIISQMLPARLLKRARNRIARFLGVRDPKRVIFTSNCTDSINMVLKGYLQPGSHVIASNLDHNAVFRPLESLKRNGVIELTRLPFEGQGYLTANSILSMPFKIVLHL